MHPLRTRIELRDTHKRGPAAAEVEEHSLLHFEDQVTFEQVSAVFRSGDGVHRHFLPSHNVVTLLVLTGVQYYCRRCVLYDICLSACDDHPEPEYCRGTPIRSS
jgi:hypothetical protein